ncbi:DNA starvation/stationary phase protection protein [Temperatibacter marinus]|uniref:DNA starvation/stationary phase protection protein n=1 Tax=Temperatibacter marinus TaxID=1456591 RepID=A0AA52EHM2_9PROT|nr:DNA starvation/stationary phase protection protein [Temperatibacter marinus]WND02674.1 DNA starvation/stationary phase protection protein [Temperatibacter marinus]
MTLNNGIDRQSQAVIASQLKNILADSITLYALTQNVHWNVTGPLFQSVHAMTEDHYLELATAIDDIAERIRALDVKVPLDLSGHKSEGHSVLTENSDAKEMVEALVRAHETLARGLRASISTAADASDEVTAGLLTDRLTIHEKTAWMLRALLQ